MILSIARAMERSSAADSGWKRSARPYETRSSPICWPRYTSNRRTSTSCGPPFWRASRIELADGRGGVHDHRQVAVHRLGGGRGDRPQRVGREREQPVRVEMDGRQQRPAGQVPGIGNRRMRLPQRPVGPSRGIGDPRGAPGMEMGVPLFGSFRTVGGSRPAQGLVHGVHDALQIGHVPGTWRLARVAGGGHAHQADPQVPRLAVRGWRPGRARRRAPVAGSGTTCRPRRWRRRCGAAGRSRPAPQRPMDTAPDAGSRAPPTAGWRPAPGSERGHRTRSGPGRPDR